MTSISTSAIPNPTLSPQAYAHEALTVNELTLGEIMQTGQLLMPGDIVTGLNTTRNYNDLETAITLSLSPPDVDRGETYLKNPLATQLRPKGFHGELRNGIALVMPVDDETEDFITSRRKGHPLTDERIVRLLVHADMYSTGRGVLNNVNREVIYYETKDYTNRDAKRFVIRILGDSNSLKASEDLVDSLNTNSENRAHLVASHALRHLYLGGLPGKGKRQ